MDLYRCQREAQEIGFDSAKFKARFPAGVFSCKWIDAYMGIFVIDADGLRDGFVTVKSILEDFPNTTCFDLEA